MDVFSKSDPMCVVWLKDTVSNGIYREIGRTECLMNTLNPEWSKKITITYFFEENQMMRFEL